jgi:hypothetical protein
VRFLDAILPPVRRAGRYESYTVGGNTYSGTPVTMTWSKTPAEPIGSNFDQMVDGALKSDGVVSAVELVRMSVFSEARFQWQTFNNGRPGDLFGSAELALLERPWVGGTTGDLLARMILHADFAGNSYTASIGDELVPLRPDWTDIVLSARLVDVPDPDVSQSAQVGYRRAGYAYYEGGDRLKTKPVFFLPDEVAHFAPYPDPCANYRGMSWLTPVCREIEADKQMSEHKSKFLENAATPNLAVSLPKEIDADDFEAFVEAMDRSHKGADNAGKTLYLAGGADPTVIGQNMQQMDFKSVQGAGETRIAAAAGVGAILANLSEGMQGSSLNAGNYAAAKRRFADGTMRPLWRNAAGSLEVLLRNPNPATRLTYDSRDVAFLREDERDRAEIQGLESRTIRTLLDAGYDAESVKAAVLNSDWSLLTHSGLFSVQLQTPNSGPAAGTKVPGPTPAATGAPA